MENARPRCRDVPDGDNDDGDDEEEEEASGQLLRQRQARLTSAVFRTPLPELPRAESSQNQNTTDIAPLFPVGWRDAARRRDGEIVGVCVRACA
ncbi:hypothetical protein P5V15_003696 [Pogonomyrmex californicus]